MTAKDDLTLYALSAAYHAVLNIPEWLPRIRSVILFGSIAQGRGAAMSDVDLFFDTDISAAQQQALRSSIRKALAGFRLSQEALAFKLRGIDNEIQFFVGKLDEWEDLQRSISATGIMLYGNYARPANRKTLRKTLRHSLLVFWEAGGTRRGAFLNKMYGYAVKGKRYKGFIERCGGTRIGKSAAMIPIEHKSTFFDIVERYRVNYHIIEVWQ